MGRSVVLVVRTGSCDFTSLRTAMDLPGEATMANVRAPRMDPSAVRVGPAELCPECVVGTPAKESRCEPAHEPLVERLSARSLRQPSVQREARLEETVRTLNDAGTRLRPAAAPGRSHVVTSMDGW